MTTKIKLLQEIKSLLGNQGGSNNSTYTTVDASGVIITGGTSQTLAASDNNRIKVIIQAFKTNTEDLWINVNNPASNTVGSLNLEPNDVLVLEIEEAFNEINVFSVTAGQAFTVKSTSLLPT